MNTIPQTFLNQDLNPETILNSVIKIYPDLTKYFQEKEN